VICSLTLVACTTLLPQAPLPSKPPLPADPDRAVEMVEKETQAIQRRAREAVAQRRKALLAHLHKLQADYAKKGQKKEAAAVRERIVVLEVAWAAGIDPAVAFKGLKAAAVGGKYRHLLRVLAVPADRQSYSGFNDHGLWNGTSYAGVNGLPIGYWVYVYPHWYIWRNGPGNP
jgi:hypothetical protein